MKIAPVFIVQPERRLSPAAFPVQLFRGRAPHSSDLRLAAVQPPGPFSNRTLHNILLAYYLASLGKFLR